MGYAVPARTPLVTGANRWHRRSHRGPPCGRRRKVYAAPKHLGTRTSWAARLPRQRQQLDPPTRADRRRDATRRRCDLLVKQRGIVGFFGGGRISLIRNGSGWTQEMK